MAAGCGKQRFEFIFQDSSGQPIEGVAVYYVTEAQEEIKVGESGPDGSVLVEGAHLKLPRQFDFRKIFTGGSKHKRFDQTTCEILTYGGRGRYTFFSMDGLVRKSDLKHKLHGKKWPGRVVRLIAPEADKVTKVEPQTRMLQLSGPPNATVRINGRQVGTIPTSGVLETEFCPGDSLACTSPEVLVEVESGGKTVYSERLPLPRPLEQLVVSVRTEGAPPHPRQTTETRTRQSLVRVRIQYLGLPQGCGEFGFTKPVLFVESKRRRVTPSPASDEFHTFYDLLLSPGARYRLAVGCHGEEPALATWNPWDPQKGQEWYSLAVPTDCRSINVTIRSYDPSRGLRLVPKKDAPQRGFPTASAPSFPK